MEPEKPRKKRKKDQFWRACRYLAPHRGLVTISIVCAFVVGAAFTGGLGTLLPIMQVLIKNGSVQDWVNRQVVESRLDVRLVDTAHEVRIAELTHKHDRDYNHFKTGQVLSLPGAPDGPRGVSRLLSALSDSTKTTVPINLDGQPVTAGLHRAPTHLAIAQRLAQKMPTDPIKSIAVILAFLLFLSVFGNIVRFFQEYLSEKAAILAVRDIRHHLYDHTLHLPLTFFGQKGTSDVTSRLTQEAQGLQDGLKSLLGNSVQESIKAVMALGAALYVSLPLTIFVIVFGPLMFLLIKKFGKKIRRTARAALENSAVVLGQIEASLMGLRVVKASRAERFERRRFRAMTDKLTNEQLKIARMEAFNTPMLEVLTLIVVCVIVLYASYMVIVRHSLDNTRFFFVMACLMGIGESLRRVSKINNLLQKSNAAAARIFEMIDLPVERPRHPLHPVTGPRGRKILPPLAREVAFQNITFSYPGASAPALKNVTLRVARGESVAIVGRNGSGKTTLLSLLPRFYEPDQGRILIDGADIHEVALGSLRRQIGIVTQDAVIFPGTIADNVAYGMPLAKRDQIIAAARKGFAHDFIMEKPNGYDTVLGEHGAQLSGGQKQRLCIARAILRQTPILILDEATSQVDAESEHLIQQAIESLMHERTTFVIAHRFSTILSADRIVVMDRGEIVGQGNHQDLMNSCPTYRQLYERQLFAA
ncbi:MAG TPA: ABC transporter ATP-binding protein [Tepidisphaeraceae bacterium]|nr:ABC transporter ATP-binding protein [Tepidisphaeraceae bacterium]